MTDRYQGKCRVCGVTGTIGPGWCKILAYDDDYNKSTEWLCPTHYKEFVDSGEKVIPPPEKCTKHPHYRGKQKPRAKCLVCEEIWNARRKDAKASSSGSGSSKT